jgi:hypothetical protein
MLAKTGGIQMTEKEFQMSMQTAKTFQGLTDNPEEQQFWTGYQRGMRRHYHGEKFGTSEEHEQWLALIDDKTRAELGRGYWIGCVGSDIQIAMKSLAKHQILSDLGRKGGAAKSERKTAAVRKNATLGGRPRKVKP